jgi:excinuclease ABC subunit B
MGRAARHLNGRAILYADKVTGSMERAMAETDRRREKQIAHNKAHNITPVGVEKSVQDIMEGARRMPTGSRTKAQKVAETRAAYSEEVAKLTPAALTRKLKQLEGQMQEHAKNLEFEEAAALRDQLAEIKQLAFIG